jgi:hypothetical protein
VRAAAARLVAAARPGAAALAGVLLALVACGAPARAAFELEWPDAREAVMVGGVAEAAAWLLDARAGPVPGPRWTAAFSGGELFGLPEARGAAVDVALALDRTRVAVRTGLLGSRLYEERTVGLDVERRLSGDLACGLRVRLLGIAADGCESLWSSAVDARVARRVAGRLVLAARFENAGAAEIGGSPVSTSTQLAAALLLDGAAVEASVRTEAGLDASPALAVEAAASEWFRVRARAGTAPGTFAVGFGLGREGAAAGSRRPVVDVAWTWHPELGVSSFVSVRFER